MRRCARAGRARALTLLLALAACPSARAASVHAGDGSVGVVIDDESGIVSTFTAQGASGSTHAYNVSAATAPQGTHTLTVNVTQPAPSKAVVTRVHCMPGEDLPCSHQQVVVTEVFEASATAVVWTVSFTGLDVGDSPTPPWSVPISTGVTFADAGPLKIWAPWERGDTRDPLSPSDGHYSWWTGEYIYGCAVCADHPDLVVAEHVTVLDEGADAGITLMADPHNFPARTWVNLTGPSLARRADGDLASCPTPTACPGPAGYSLSRHYLKLSSSKTHTYRHLLVGHTASWRAGMARSVAEFPTFWEPTNEHVKEIEGLGSYSSFLGNVTDPKFKEMGYKLNWDLSGRFFPYMGQFLPPVKPGEVWLNDAEGTQVRANVTFAIINDYYSRLRAENFSTFSYWNVFEYGENVCIPPSATKGCVPTPGAPSSTDAWNNSSDYMLKTFPDALVTDYNCGGHSGCRGGSNTAIYTWQNGVIIDPHEAKMAQHYHDQLDRKYDNLPAFQGLVVDRSDWNALYFYNQDDGASWIGNRSSWNAQLSYIEIMTSLRERMGNRSVAGQDGSNILQNAVGFAQLSLMEPFDGTFSEGGATNAVGLLSMRSTAILWTYNSKTCCASPAVATDFFQRHLYMGVYPMAPFPMNDHAIAPDPAAEAYYLRYGPLFTALRGHKWYLQPDAFRLQCEEPAAVANVFEFPGTATLMWPIMFGGSAAAANITVGHLPPGASTFAVLHPGNADWKPLPPLPLPMPQGQFMLTVPLVSGCALLRVDAA